MTGFFVLEGFRLEHHPRLAACQNLITLVTKDAPNTPTLLPY